jgi:hypothetical protein
MPPIFKLCPKILKSFQKLGAYAQVYKIYQKQFEEIYKYFGLMHPIFKMCPKNFQKKIKKFGSCPNFQNVHKNFEKN